MDHRLEINGVAREIVRGLRLVAEDTELGDSPGAAAMDCQRIMALVAGLGSHHVPHLCHWSAGRHEVEGGVGVIAPSLDKLEQAKLLGQFAQIPGCLDAYCMRGVGWIA